MYFLRQSDVFKLEISKFGKIFYFLPTNQDEDGLESLDRKICAEREKSRLCINTNSKFEDGLE